MIPNHHGFSSHTVRANGAVPQAPVNKTQLRSSTVGFVIR